MKAKIGWLKDPDCLEYRRTINGAQCVVRPVREPEKLTVWSCSIHRDNRDVDVSTHSTHWTAMAFALEGATR